MRISTLRTLSRTLIVVLCFAVAMLVSIAPVSAAPSGHRLHTSAPSTRPGVGRQNAIHVHRWVTETGAVLTTRPTAGTAATVAGCNEDIYAYWNVGPNGVILKQMMILAVVGDCNTDGTKVNEQLNGYYCIPILWGCQWDNGHKVYGPVYYQLGPSTPNEGWIPQSGNYATWSYNFTPGNLYRGQNDFVVYWPSGNSTSYYAYIQLQY